MKTKVRADVVAIHELLAIHSGSIQYLKYSCCARTISAYEFPKIMNAHQFPDLVPLEIHERVSLGPQKKIRFVGSFPKLTSIKLECSGSFEDSDNRLTSHFYGPIVQKLITIGRNNLRVERVVHPFSGLEWMWIAKKIGDCCSHYQGCG